MKTNINLYKNICNFFIIILSLSYINTKNEETIEYKKIEIDKNYSSTFSNSENFLIIPKIEVNFTSFMKIKTEGKKDDNILRVISYYNDDSTFKNRTQLSYNIGGKTIMYLNKEQILKPFYLSIECDEKCDNKLEINLTEFISLNVGEQYTYFVTKENIISHFKVEGTKKITKKDQNSSIILWAKGNKNIISEINSDDKYQYQKHSKYNGYMINIGKNLKSFDYKFDFIISGKEGDLINVGALFYDGSKDSVCDFTFVEGVEITGFLKKNIKNINCFKIPELNTTTDFLQSVVYDNKNVKFDYDPDKSLYCAELVEESDEAFYSIYYYNKINNNKIKFPPLINNAEYFTQINKDITIGLIPMKPSENSKYLTYYINPVRGKYEAGIYTCENYPLCPLDLIKNSSKEIKYFNSFCLSYIKEEIDESINSISKRQKILILKSKTELIRKNYLYMNIYDEEYNLILKESILYTKYSRKGMKENYLIYQRNQSFIDSIYIFVEKLYGNIEISFNENQNMTHLRYIGNNKKLYIVNNPTKKNFNISFNILSARNSFYKIIYMKVTNKYVNFKILDINYLINFQGIGNKIINFITNRDINKIFLGFYPIDCQFNITSGLTNKNLKLKNHSFYQEIINTNEIKMKTFNYTLMIKEKNISEVQSCNFSISLYKLDNTVDLNSLNGIILENNISQPFLFNKAYKKFKFFFFFSQTYKNLSINLKSDNNEKYNLTLLNKEFKNQTQQKYIIISNATIPIENKVLKKLCQNEQQICDIEFEIISNNILNESILEINTNFEENIIVNKTISNSTTLNNKNFFNINNPLFILSIFGVLVFTLIIILIIIGIRYKCKNKDLIKEVNTISFVTEQEKDDFDDIL